MAKLTKTAETENATIVASLTRQVNDKTAYADGYNLITGRELYQRYEVQLTSKRNGKSILSSHPEIAHLVSKTEKRDKAPTGAYARLGDAYISQQLYDLIVGMCAQLDAELGKSDEWVALEAEAAERKRIGLKNLEQREAEMAERAKNSGWCPICKDWTYGDCGHN